jgi:hypothetical protein
MTTDTKEKAQLAASEQVEMKKSDMKAFILTGKVHKKIMSRF